MGLSSHLIVKTRPLAAKENFVLWGDYRVTVLGERLFRIEHNAAHKWRDDATQVVWFRDMPVQKFTVFAGGECVVDTGACKLFLRALRENCTIDLGEGEIKLDNEGNLLGTYRTLDGCDADVFRLGEAPEKIHLGGGVCSRSGVALFDDGKSLTLGTDGEVKPERGSGTDEYVFAFGNDYRGAVKALYMIAGPVPMIPRFALGNWWSRYHAYTDKEYLRLINRFAEHRVPLSVATIDMDWHYSNNVQEECGLKDSGRNTLEYNVTTGNVGWTGYTWNKNLFPDYRAFLKELERKKLKITLNLHPSDGVRWWEKQYAEMCAAMGRDALTYLPVPFDFSDSVFINNYFKILHKPYERDGVAFWWIDWQQGTQSAVDGLDPLWALNHYHYLDSAEEHAAPLILSRYSGVGAHRYPLGFSGDTYVTWETLGYLPYFTLTASNIGYTWWSHDIGGHMHGVTDGELYVRFIQLGVFSPVNRLHCSCDETFTKEPFLYGNGTGDIAARYLRLRHGLIPYLYTEARRTHVDGVALVEPLYYRHAQEEAYRYKNEFYFGSELLVAPVTEKRKKDGYARVSAWLPEGVWTDIFTGDRYEIGRGGEARTLLRKLDDIPVFARAGTILPLSKNEGNGADNPAVLEVLVYRGKGAYTLFEDGAETGKKGELFTQFATEEKEGVQALTISSRGDAGIIPADRILRVKFADIPEGRVRLFENGKEVEVNAPLCDNAMAVINFEAGKEYRLEVAFAAESAAEYLVRRAREELTRAECGNDLKVREWGRIRIAKNVSEFVVAVRRSRLPAGIKARLLECVPAVALS